MSNIDSKILENLLYLDVGNSAIKAAFHKKGNWESVHFNGKSHASGLIEWVNESSDKFSGVVMASVREEVGEAVIHELEGLAVITLKVEQIPRAMLDYETPQTLGVDRFLACYGAVESTGKPVVVIDAGTACTIDFMSADEVFRGGVIAPGFSSFTGLLSEHAPALPFIDSDTSTPEIWPGKSTKDSLKWGQAGFYRDALLGALNRYEKKYGAFDLFLTGGDALKVEALLKRESKVRPFLVFDGMRRMLSWDNVEF